MLAYPSAQWRGEKLSLRATCATARSTTKNSAESFWGASKSRQTASPSAGWPVRATAAESMRATRSRLDANAPGSTSTTTDWLTARGYRALMARPRGAKDRAPVVVKLLADLYPDAQCALQHSNAYELLVATILSAQSTDVRVNM